jgi:hypothetical protein
MPKIGAEPRVRADEAVRPHPGVMEGEFTSFESDDGEGENAGEQTSETAS